MLNVMLTLGKVYLLIGVIWIGIEWMFCAIAQGSVWGSEDSKDHICEALAYIFEIFIWPVQFAKTIKEAKHSLRSPQYRHYIQERFNEKEEP